jgi:hypothetical protein
MSFNCINLVKKYKNVYFIQNSCQYRIFIAGHNVAIKDYEENISNKFSVRCWRKPWTAQSSTATLIASSLLIFWTQLGESSDDNSTDGQMWLLLRVVNITS